jgi:hypothetical protein
VTPCCSWQVAPGQRRFVATVERSLAQVAYEPAGWPMAIYSGDDPVGFMLLYDARKDKDKTRRRSCMSGG